MQNQKQSKGLNIQAKFFVTSCLIIFALMCLVYILTFIVPGGEYARTMDADGNMLIDASGAFTYVDGGLPFWKWLLSPILVLIAEGSGTIIAIIVFLLVIGGVFNSLDKCGLMSYMLDKIVHHFRARRYKMLAIMILFFMALGAFIGSFEECVPLVPIVVALAISMGWDDLTGLGMSLLAAGCGFAAGVCNPFTIGVAQELAGLPMFSGIWFRLVCFVVIYLILFAFIYLHAKKVERPVTAESMATNFCTDQKMDKSLCLFAGILGTGIVLVMCSAILPALQDYTMIIVAVMFLVAGVTSVLTTGMKGKEFGIHFWNGLVSIFPAVLMILMASSIKYTLVEANILDTVLFKAVEVAEHLPKEAVILFIYLIVLLMNFFISSGSAKAFLLVPLVVPLAQIFNISAQLSITAFAFGDGFSNVFYPTNPVLLISLGLANVSYVKWVKWTWKFQTINLVATALLLLVGLAIGY
ncbi:MAG: YfcC family protein [Lachnospiraceae bacterium]|nr:YfcC family protein [Lachnospiraceae bacterium]